MYFCGLLFSSLKPQSHMKGKIFSKACKCSNFSNLTIFEEGTGLSETFSKWMTLLAQFIQAQARIKHPRQKLRVFTLNSLPSC